MLIAGGGLPGVGQMDLEEPLLPGAFQRKCWMQRKCSNSVTGVGGQREGGRPCRRDMGREALWGLWPLDWDLKISNIQRGRAQKTGFLAQDQLETGLLLSVWDGVLAHVSICSLICSFPWTAFVQGRRRFWQILVLGEGSLGAWGPGWGCVLGVHGCLEKQIPQVNAEVSHKGSLSHSSLGWARDPANGTSFPSPGPM